MDVVVEVEQSDLVLGEPGLLCLEDSVVPDVVDLVLMQIERRLVGDDHVGTHRLRPFAHLEGGHHRRGDALDRGVGGSREQVVNGRRAPGNAYILLDAVDDGADGEGARMRRLRGGTEGENERAGSQG